MRAQNFSFRFGLFTPLLFLLVSQGATAKELICPRPQVYGRLFVQNDELLLALNEDTLRQQVLSLEFKNLGEAIDLLSLDGQYINATIERIIPETQKIQLKSYKLSRKDFLNPSAPPQTSIQSLFECQQQKRTLASIKKTKKSK